MGMMVSVELAMLAGMALLAGLVVLEFIPVAVLVE